MRFYMKSFLMELNRRAVFKALKEIQNEREEAEKEEESYDEPTVSDIAERVEEKFGELLDQYFAFGVYEI
jgi:hypothetical protein